MAGLASGSLDRRIRLERATEADDGMNTVAAWGELATRWAQYIPARGQEARAALGQEATLPATFRIRWDRTVADLSPSDRLRLPAPDGQVYDIKSAVEIGRREGIEIVALAVAEQLTDEQIAAIRAAIAGDA